MSSSVRTRARRLADTGTVAARRLAGAVAKCHNNDLGFFGLTPDAPETYEWELCSTPCSRFRTSSCNS